MKAHGQGLALEIAKHLKGLDDRALQADALEQAQRCLVDFFAVSLAAKYMISLSANKTLRVECGQRGDATILVSGAHTSFQMAALLNGTIAHALDFDDTLWTYVGHTTAVIFPAVFALAEIRKCSGSELLAAFILGTEAAHLIGSPVSGHLRSRGFHPTPVIGVFGAATAATLLYGGDDERLGAAITLAVNLASGVRQNFGSPAKSLGAGWAAQGGLMAALLAEQGFSGSVNALEGSQGFYQAFAGSTVSADLKRMDELALVSPGVGFKLYPCCTGTHPVIEALLKLRAEFARQSTWSVRRIVSVKIEVTPEVIGELIYPLPATAAQARFSLPFCAATALVDGEVVLSHFKEPFVVSSDVRELMRRIEVLTENKLERTGNKYCPAARVTLMTECGDQLQQWIGAARGNPGNPASDQDLDRKFYACARAGGLSHSSAGSLLGELRSFQEVTSVGEWINARLIPLVR